MNESKRENADPMDVSTRKRVSTSNRHLSNTKYRKKNSKQPFILLIVIVAVFIIFFIQRSKQPDNTVKKTNTEAQKLLAKDITIDYPATPTAVVKMYSRISKCLYNNNWENDEVNGLIEMIRLLYSEELLKNNPDDKYMASFKADIADYKDKKRTIMTYQIEGNSQIKTWDKEGIEYASLNTQYSMAEQKEHYKVFQEFLLKKDANSQWKIVGWKSIPEIDIIGN